jgi:hypothetical protein
VSKFHPFWCPVAQESKLRRKFLGRPDISGSITGYIRRTGHIWSKAGHVYRGVSAATFVHCFGHILLTGCLIDPIFFDAFITLKGSFLCCWLVCSSLSCRVLALGFELGT